MEAKYTPNKSQAVDWHRADIRCALEKAGWSLRRLSIANGLSPNTLPAAMGTTMYPRGERIIAKVIGVPPEEIWPSRFAMRAARAASRHDKKVACRRNGKVAGAA